jgi:hypothetical protein
MAKTKIAALATSLIIVTAPAMAQEKAPFDGLYGGIEAGVDWTKLGTDRKRDRSTYYGGVIGYRSQMNNGLVVGLEGTFGDSGYNNNALGINSDYEWSTSLTLGSTFGDGNNLLYGKAGYAQTRFDPILATADKYNDGGLRLGGGYERSLNESLSLRLSGDYTTYGNEVGQWQTKAGLLVKF